MKFKYSLNLSISIERTAHNLLNNVFNKGNIWDYYNDRKKTLVKLKEELETFYTDKEKLTFLNLLKEHSLLFISDHELTCIEEKCLYKPFYELFSELIENEARVIEKKENQNMAKNNITINHSNIVIGNNNSQSIINQSNDELIDELKDFVGRFEEEIQKLKISDDDATDLKDQIIILNRQANKQEPNMSIIGNTLKVLYDLSTEVAGSAISTPILLKFQSLIEH